MEDTSARKQSRTPATAIRVTVVVAAMLAVTAATLGRSHSAFSGTTSYGERDNLIQSATVGLGKEAEKTFEVNNMVPGDTIVRCVDVTYNGTATAERLESVRVFGAETSGGGLTEFVSFKAGIGNAGKTCASPDTVWSEIKQDKMATVFANHSTYATAYDSTWTPSATGEKRAFRFTVTMPDSTGNEAQGKSATPTITWEIHTKNGTQR